jgi:mono/diheme cytochrome c family protein
VLLRTLSAFLLAAVPALIAADTKGIDFNRDIRPILSDNCFACHGPDDSKRMAGIRLDTREGALAALTPGKPETSRLYLRAAHPDPKRRMPPPASGKSLTAPQVELLQKWIAAGADWKMHWAYEKPLRHPLPATKNRKWARNPIDHFVLARLEQEGLAPSAEADRITLLRRLSFDLTGLPPTPAEIDAFLKDKSANAFEKQVDRLLASSHYGERMAMPWLDQARYADTHGFHIDSHRDMWPWRDWVIRAFNANMPFDRFTVEQLAGDLLPNATLDQKVASGFNRNHMINYEGGAIPDEYLTEYVADRAETTSTVWMAMTMTCARCHDHKYDPIKQKDYYRLFAFFNGVKEKGLDGRDGNADPFLRLPTSEQQRQFDELTARIKTLDAQLADSKIKPAQEQWEAQRLALLDYAAPAGLRNGLLAQYEMDGTVNDHSGAYRHAQALRGEPAMVLTSVGKATLFATPSHLSLGKFDLGAEYAIAAWVVQGHHEPQTLLRQPGRLEVWWDASEPLPHLRRGAHLHLEAPGLHLRTRDRLVQGEQYHVAILHSQAGGLTLRINGQAVPVVREAESRVSASAVGPLQIGQQTDTETRNGFRGRLADLRIYRRVLTENELRYLAVDHRLSHMLAVPAKQRPKELIQRLREHYLTYAAPAANQEAWAELKSLRERKAQLDDAIPNTMVMAEMDSPRDTFVLARGDYRNHGEKVTPNVPAVLPPLAPGAKPDRLALANWLVHPDHPLTARVAVNRYWQNYFGIGLVKSSENFGTQGDPPSHPELLDWLATEFQRSGWDVKAMQRLIVTSATYRQSSKTTPALVERDPENRLLARMSRFRLQAELVRDNALAISGLLNTKVGGRSTYPYQPPGIWEEISRGEIFSAQVYKESKGEDQYRRGMYWFWKRTAPPASLSTFDAPDREKCVARRSVTNTPLQALVLLNDPSYVEASRVLAQNVLREAGPDPAKRVALAFRKVTGRTPEPREAAVLSELVSKQAARYARDSKSAEALLAIGDAPVDRGIQPAELAAWTNLATVLLNMDEAITKE